MYSMLLINCLITVFVIHFAPSDALCVGSAFHDTYIINLFSSLAANFIYKRLCLLLLLIPSARTLYNALCMLLILFSLRCNSVEPNFA
ncbi:hypothetical protein BJ138DRAFT_464083 [Hygrophoropsis aurantiaca]|uniref:Uncharacterized protein n=1 Tax=Hygrophoropsis aurantiaca TaxID=72124 RepID=A0ACB8ASB4_9AGAM|nr:hypothetical protein BJ138DRAFT_464083 [Hygrophoropsis aurantiaca]